ncbi:MAG: hypothetical protein ACKO7W_00190 [Elainella sp.]
MNTGLKRIEATLGQLNAGLKQPPQLAESATSVESPGRIQAFPLPETPIEALISPAPEQMPSTKPVARTKAASKQTGSAKAQPQSSSKASGKANGRPAVKQPPNGPKSKPNTVQTFPTQEGTQAPLPKAKPPSFSSHRHAVNPNLAVGLLREVESVVVGWQLSLEQTVLEIQALYLEGPIVDGWLESHPVGSPQVMQSVGTATLRHAEIDRLMEYVEEICRMPQPPEPSETVRSEAVHPEPVRTGYRLCGLDADGALWSRPCPQPQVPYVGLAIARYQKLRILLARKQDLETRLNQLIQTLTLLHGQMQD